MKNPIINNLKLKGKVRLGTAALALTMLGSTPQLPINPTVENVYATEIEQNNEANTPNNDGNSNTDIEENSNTDAEKYLEAIKKLEDTLNYACSFSTQKGGHITYIDSSHGDFRNHGKLEKGYSDCSWYIFRVLEHEGILNEHVKSEKWGYGGCPNSVDVAHFEKGEKWDYSNASPGDIIWEHHGSGRNNHVYFYLGNGKKVSCSSGHKKGEGVNIGKVHEANSKSTKGIERKIIHLKAFDFPNSTKAYFDPDKGKLVYEEKEIDVSYVLSNTNNEHSSNNEKLPDNVTETNSKTATNNEQTNTTEIVNFTQDETLMTIDCANIKCAGQPKIKRTAHGDMTMIGSDGHYLMIDTSEDDLRDSVIKFMNDKNYKDKHFDILITHNHDDHWGNAVYLMKNYKVDTLYLPEGKESMYSKLERIAKQKGIRVVRLKQYDTFYIGKAKFEVLYNPNNKRKDYNNESYTNNKSLVLRISVQTLDGKEIRYLTCGDIEAGLEKELLEEGIDVRADIFKLSHHSMKTSNIEEFIVAIQPKYTISNWWQDNSKKFPTTESTIRVARAGKFGIVYSVIYNNGVKFSVSAHGVITPEIYQNVEIVPYVIQDTQGNTISTFNLQIPKDAKVRSYKPKKELNVEQQQAIVAQIKDKKEVGDMIYKANTLNTRQGATTSDGVRIIKIDDVNMQNGVTTLSNLNTTRENMVEPRARDIPNFAERLFGTVAGLLGEKRKYSMVIPMPNTQGIICDENGSYEDPNQLYSLNSEKMYPAYYAVNPKFDTAEKNCRVIKDEIVDENGNIKEIYALVNNGSLLKTVRTALVIRNTKLTDQNGTVYNVQAGRKILIVGNMAIVSELTMNGKDVAGTIPSSDLLVYNDKWKEVFIETNDIHTYYDNITKKYVWGGRTGRKKMTICSPENIKITEDNKKCLGTEVKEQTPGELEARFTLIGKLGEKDKDNQNEIEK